MTRNPTELALIARGMDSALARTLREAGWTLATLKQKRPAELADLGIPADAAGAITRGRRSSIPLDALVSVLFANRWLCCVCRNEDRPVIVHHINPWAESHDHSPGNLAVLCSIHHGEAHSTHALELTLTADRLKSAKSRWETQVNRLDSRSILRSTQLQSCQWWYFNHLRVYEIAQQLGLDLTEVDGFQDALEAGLCDEQGCPRYGSGPVYRGSTGLTLSRYMRSIVVSSLDYAVVRNVSDDLDRGTLKSIVVPDDLIFVQGSYCFSGLPSDGSGADCVQGIRSVNGIEIALVFDRNEGTSVSARTVWLQGTQTVGCLLRVNRISRNPRGGLRIDATVLAIRSADSELKTRTYEIGLYLSGLLGKVDEEEEDLEEDWLDEDF